MFHVNCCAFNGKWSKHHIHKNILRNVLFIRNAIFSQKYTSITFTLAFARLPNLYVSMNFKWGKLVQLCRINFALALLVTSFSCTTYSYPPCNPLFGGKLQGIGKSRIGLNFLVNYKSSALLIENKIGSKTSSWWLYLQHVKSWVQWGCTL